MIDISRHQRVRAFLYNLLIFLLLGTDSEDSILTLTIFTFSPQIEITYHRSDSLKIYNPVIFGMGNIDNITPVNFRAFLSSLEETLVLE